MQQYKKTFVSHKLTYATAAFAYEKPVKHSINNISKINKPNQGESSAFPHRIEHSFHALNISMLSLSEEPLEGSRQGLLVADDPNHFVALNCLLYLTQVELGETGGRTEV